MAESTDQLVLRESKKIITSQKQNERAIAKKHVLKKRIPLCFPKRNKDIYITNRTSFKAQLNRCEKLLVSGQPELIIHALGAAINRACNLALQLKNNHCGTLELDINTSTVDLIDDLEPLYDDGDYEINNRQNSSIHIRVYQTVPIGALKYAK
ncbi:ribonuclease P protein subunit p20 [Venturia canescens]|uniref:ribonuclease P protein subunit p20 n=1 Tax=Venturia canescens TaxID=32260 RepID=UPI001C9D0175|nr:ribonuclease P protein subunit p20 [Venturia canescens]